MTKNTKNLPAALLASAACVLLPAVGAAGIIDYGFTGAHAVLGGQPVSITGTVVGTDGALGEIQAQIRLTGPGSGFAGLYTLPFYGGLYPAASHTFTAGNLTIGYADDLSLTSVSINSTGGVFTDTTPTGAATIIGRSIGYTFSPGSSVTVNGVREDITSGSFEFDPLTQIEWVANGIRLTGAVPYAGNCFSSTLPASSDAVYAHCSTLGDAGFHFANDLSATEADPLVYVTSNFGISPATGYALPYGVAAPAAAVPEPSSLILMAASLLLLGARQRRC